MRLVGWLVGWLMCFYVYFLILREEGGTGDVIWEVSVDGRVELIYSCDKIGGCS